MKKWIGFILCLLMVTLCAAALAANVAINETNFPDDNFRRIVAGFDTEEPLDVLTDAEIAEATWISVKNEGIRNLKGIHFFTALETLYCDTNPDLTELDLSANKQLTSLNCDDTGLTSLNLSGLSKLASLSCCRVKMQSLNLSGCSGLKKLYCYRNSQLTQLDLSANKQLNYINCSDTGITRLSLAGHSALETLDCNSSKVSELNISGCSALATLDCCINPLSELDISGSPKLCKVVNSSDRRHDSSIGRDEWASGSLFPLSVPTDAVVISDEKISFSVGKTTTVIQSAGLTLTAPAAGTTSAAAPNLTVPSGGHYSLQKAAWISSDGTESTSINFAAGGTYQLKAVLKAESGYSFTKSSKVAVSGGTLSGNADAKYSASESTLTATISVTLSGSGSDPAPGSDPGTAPGSDPGTTPGSDPGTTPGSDPGTTPGSDPGAAPGSESGTEEQITLKKIKISKVTASSKKKIKVQWKKLSKKVRKQAKMIEVQVSPDKSFQTDVITKKLKSSKTSVSVSGLKKNTKYYVRIRVYTEDGNIRYVSPWSSVKKVKTKKK